MLKQCKVVMLPTNQKAKEGMIYLKPKIGIFNEIASENHNNGVYDCKPQHLYIISDDEIKEGDWCINTGGNIKDSFPFRVTKEVMNNKFIKKIIATTDSSLEINSNFDYNHLLPNKNDFRFYLPQPSEQFIQKYIEEYNRGNIITDVLVEYELISNEEYFLNTINPDDDVPYFDERLKINHKDNTITIKKIKDSYSREEVEKLLIECCGEISCEDGKLLGKNPEELYKWIKENL